MSTRMNTRHGSPGALVTAGSLKTGDWILWGGDPVVIRKIARHGVTITIVNHRGDEMDVTAGQLLRRALIPVRTTPTVVAAG